MVEYIGITIGILTFIGGLLAWYKGAVEKDYASKRDWGHVKNSQQQLSQNVGFLFKDMDARFDRVDAQLLELKGMFYASLSRQERQRDEK